MAPLLVDETTGALGMQQGIVGAETDVDRAKQMVAEAHNPNGVFRLLQIQGSFVDLLNNLSDNRDFSVLSYEILHERERSTAEAILGESLRRAHQHNLLIRSVLCLEATKGPKKGKAMKPTAELQKRCISLLTCADKTEELCNSIALPAHTRPLLQAMRELCVVIVSLSSGHDLSGEFSLESMDAREEAICVALEGAIEFLEFAKSNFAEAGDVSLCEICRMTADFVVSIFTTFEIASKIVDQYGWGRRKRKTKRCAATVAELACIFAAYIADMLTILER
jgi:hypothetical protein